MRVAGCTPGAALRCRWRNIGELTLNLPTKPVSVHAIESADGALLLSITTDDERNAGGMVRVTPAALAALPDALWRLNAERGRKA